MQGELYRNCFNSIVWWEDTVTGTHAALIRLGISLQPPHSQVWWRSNNDEDAITSIAEILLRGPAYSEETLPQARLEWQYVCFTVLVMV